VALKIQAKAYGMTPEEVTLAIREWAARAADPYEKGLAALFDRKYAEATRSLTASYELRKKAAEEFVDAAFFLGQSLWHQGKYTEAVEKLQEVNAFRKNETEVLLMLGLSLNYAGKYAEAESIYRQDLPLAEQKFGKNSVEVGVVLNNLGLACRLQKKLDEAERLYNEALAINRAKLGDEAPLTANTLNNLGTLSIDKNDYVEAERLLKEALTIRDKKLGRNHPDTAITVDNLGYVYLLQGRYGEAEPLLKQALDIKERTFGYEHPITANSYGHLATFYSNQCRYAEAIPMYEKWLAINERLVEGGSSSITLLNNIGVAYHKQDKYIEAERYYKRAINICATTNPDECYMTYRNLGKLYTTQGKFVEAEPLFKRAVAIFEKDPSKPNVRIVFVLESYAELLHKTNREQEAKAMENRAKEIRARTGFYGKN
jgi:tetratricopeptide (TPR) repeat protein